VGSAVGCVPIGLGGRHGSKRCLGLSTGIVASKPILEVLTGGMSVGSDGSSGMAFLPISSTSRHHLCSHRLPRRIWGMLQRKGAGQLNGYYTAEYLLDISVAPPSSGLTIPPVGSYWYDSDSEVVVRALSRSPALIDGSSTA